MVYGGFRNYYGRKRIKKSNLRNNSGNYFGLFSSYRFKAIGPEDNRASSKTYTIGPVWGMERNYASGIHLGLSVGPGIVGGNSTRTRATVVEHFEIGFRLFAK
ncbi:MAG: hypothetical protein GY816_24520 [Cytophagales bacterium]|nr:hypothetical protein [Cytophagales bacterium]